MLAGGQAVRFGRDKLSAELNGATFLQLAHRAVLEQVDEAVICGRKVSNEIAIVDWPSSRLGPLGGLCAAMRYAVNARLDYVLSIPADTYPVPKDLINLLSGETPAVFYNHWLFGFWPSAYFPALESYLNIGQRSVKGWLRKTAPRLVDDSLFNLTNVNTVSDLNALKVSLNGIDV
ncbi:molybdenum cofactor guanylyltransferase [Sphingopyxis sp. BSNA05]|uniref:molybdenum cofactor guanylyltransferase n=1 Tax=Sphingopyxis sp. BSNA05 TaxID=1236614 RepID=UPI00349F47C7